MKRAIRCHIAKYERYFTAQDKAFAFETIMRLQGTIRDLKRRHPALRPATRTSGIRVADADSRRASARTWAALVDGIVGHAQPSPSETSQSRSTAAHHTADPFGARR